MDALDNVAETRVSGRSSLYRSKPWGLGNQPDFVNAVARLDTGLSARKLLRELLAIERMAGRTRDGVRWGPRVIDLDLLVHGGEIHDEDGLQVPHPRMFERAFVLLPLLELEAELIVPGIGRIADRLGSVDWSGCERMGDAGS